ncbi:MAG: low-specificity L-threonine aldolase [Chitinophagales bacterium]|nr:low-specificity L-threonine aldolase [Chitinophagales bacterium]MDW8393399.1 low-specificity L-threonine aldolase [Chitinophagales bacterium]
MMTDLRSDTVTRPTPAMLQAMMSAELGDDVFGDDPTVNALQEKTARLFGMEAGLFFPTGTMSNQVAIKTHTQPGDEVVVEASSHTYLLESGGMAFHSGCSIRPVAGNRGRLSPELIRAQVNPRNDHFPVTRLVVIENTCNRGGGSYYTLEQMQAVSEAARAEGLRMHLDGARIFNALVELNVPPAALGPLFDSISICLSKGLGCPAGTVLTGSAEFIKKAKRYRKLFGGTMRQSGVLAAAGLYALDHHVQRLKEDHERARRIGEALSRQRWVRQVWPVETNIILFDLTQELPAAVLVNYLASQNILCVATGRHQIRMVTHLDITDDMVAHVVATLHAFEPVAA